MNVLGILYHASAIEKLINENIENLAALHERKKNLPASGAEIGAGGSSDNAAAYARAIEQIENVERIILQQNEEYAKVLSEILLTINKIDNLEYRLILQKKLCARKTFEVIAGELNCDERTVKRKYTDALNEFKKIIKDVPKCP